MFLFRSSVPDVKHRDLKLADAKRRGVTLDGSSLTGLCSAAAVKISTFQTQASDSYKPSDAQVIEVQNS